MCRSSRAARGEVPPARRAGRSRTVLDATLSLVGRWGVSKTALADVAKEAGCSRATVYGRFRRQAAPAVALAGRELQSYVNAIVDALDAAADLEDA